MAGLAHGESQVYLGTAIVGTRSVYIWVPNTRIVACYYRALKAIEVEDFQPAQALEQLSAETNGPLIFKEFSHP